MCHSAAQLSAVIPLTKRPAPQLGQDYVPMCSVAEVLVTLNWCGVL
jgi:hypothetical protein